MNPTTTRRDFLRHTSGLAFGAAIVPSVISASALGAGNRSSANGRVAVGCIGTGERGRTVLDGFLTQNDVQVVAACDVKTDQLALAREQINQRYQNQDCATYGDLR